jgi:hypothetical protein
MEIPNVWTTTAVSLSDHLTASTTTNSQFLSLTTHGVFFISRGGRVFQTAVEDHGSWVLSLFSRKPTTDRKKRSSNRNNNDDKTNKATLRPSPTILIHKHTATSYLTKSQPVGTCGSLGRYSFVFWCLSFVLWMDIQNIHKLTE